MRALTVTLVELGVPGDVGVVGDAILRGFATTFDVDFTSSPGPAPGPVVSRPLVDVEAAHPSVEG
jgi:hypothetical protein